MLQELLPESALVAREAAVATKVPADARERLSALLHGIVAARDAEKEHNLADAMEREERIQQLEAFAGQPEPEPLPPAIDGVKVVPLQALAAGRAAGPPARSPEEQVAFTPAVVVGPYVEPEPKKPPPGNGPIPAPKGNPEGWSRGDEPWRGFVRSHDGGLLSSWPRGR
jgi:hypothetical protein